MAQQVSPIPAGLHSITPHLMVNGAAAYIDFLTRAFGAVEKMRSPGPGGKLMHVDMLIGDSRLYFSDDFSAEFKMPPLAQGRLPFVLHLYVPDVDAVFARAVEAGAKPVMPLSNQFWGDRFGQILDPFGITWSLATHIEDLTPEQIRERQAKAFSHS